MKKFNIAIVFFSEPLHSFSEKSLPLQQHPEITENRNAGIPLYQNNEIPKCRDTEIPKCRHPDKAKKNYVGENCCTLK